MNTHPIPNSLFNLQYTKKKWGSWTMNRSPAVESCSAAADMSKSGRCAVPVCFVNSCLLWCEACEWTASKKQYLMRAHESYTVTILYNVYNDDLIHYNVNKCKYFPVRNELICIVFLFHKLIFKNDNLIVLFKAAQLYAVRPSAISRSSNFIIKVKCVTDSSTLKYCRAAEMSSSRLVILFSTWKKTLVFGTDSHKCDIIKILIVFSVIMKIAKMTIPTNLDKYCKCNHT